MAWQKWEKSIDLLIDIAEKQQKLEEFQDRVDKFVAQSTPRSDYEDSSAASKDNIAERTLGTLHLYFLHITILHKDTPITIALCKVYNRLNK